MDQQALQAVEVKAAQAVAQQVVVEGTMDADVALRVWICQAGLQLLEACAPEDEGVENGQEDALGGRSRDPAARR